MLKYRTTKKGILTNSFQHQKSRKPVYYTLNELHERFLSDKRFNRLFNEWVAAGYKKEKKPTVDRINCKKGYSMENVHCLTWEENKYKQRMEFKILFARKIGAFLNGELIMEFKSVSDAVRKTGIHQGSISSALTKARKTCRGYVWEYLGENHLLSKYNMQ
jgi:hypothetical protein